MIACLWPRPPCACACWLAGWLAQHLFWHSTCCFNPHSQLTIITGVSLSDDGNFVFASGRANALSVGTSYFAFWFLKNGVYVPSCLFPLPPSLDFATTDFTNGNASE